jgi:cytochrome c oxidase assembly factor CtaG
MSCMILAILLGLSSGAWYSAFDWAMGTYRTMSLLADQQIASGILWVFGVIPWFLAGIVVLRDTLNDEERGVNNFSDTFRSFILRRVRVASAARVPERQSATLDANSADS